MLGVIPAVSPIGVDRGIDVLCADAHSLIPFVAGAQPSVWSLAGLDHLWDRIRRFREEVAVSMRTTLRTIGVPLLVGGLFTLTLARLRQGAGGRHLGLRGVRVECEQARRRRVASGGAASRAEAAAQRAEAAAQKAEAMFSKSIRK